LGLFVLFQHVPFVTFTYAKSLTTAQVTVHDKYLEMKKHRFTKSISHLDNYALLNN